MCLVLTNMKRYSRVQKWITGQYLAFMDGIYIILKRIVCGSYRAIKLLEQPMKVLERGSGVN